MKPLNYEPEETIENFMKRVATELGKTEQDVQGFIQKLKEQWYIKAMNLTNVPLSKYQEWSFPQGLIDLINITVNPSINDNPKAKLIADSALRNQTMAKQQINQYLAAKNAADKNSLISAVTELMNKNIEGISSTFTSMQDFCTALAKAIMPELSKMIQTKFESYYNEAMKRWLLEVEVIAPGIYFGYDQVYFGNHLVGVTNAVIGGLIFWAGYKGTIKVIEKIANKYNANQAEKATAKMELEKSLANQKGDLRAFEEQKVNSTDSILSHESVVSSETPRFKSVDSEFSFGGKSVQQISKELPGGSKINPEGEVDPVGFKPGTWSEVGGIVGGAIVAYFAMMGVQWLEEKFFWTKEHVKEVFPEAVRKAIAADENTALFYVNFDESFLEQVDKVVTDSHAPTNA